jgi:hypothetical protein
MLEFCSVISVAMGLHLHFGIYDVNEDLNDYMM